LIDISNALTGSVAADGQTPVTGNINMTNNKIINLLNPSNLQDAATKDYVDSIYSANVDITGGTIEGVSHVYVGQSSAPHGGVVAAKAAGGNIIAGEITTGGPGTTFISVANATAGNYDHFGAYHLGSPTRLFGVGSDGATSALSFTQTSGFSNASSGYVRLPSGLIMQWGTYTIGASTSTTFNYPIAFPTAQYATFTTNIITVANPSEPIGLDSLTRTNFVARNANGSTFAFFMVALGI
jgi:hypothetical protein